METCSDICPFKEEKLFVALFTDMLATLILPTGHPITLKRIDLFFHCDNGLVSVSLMAEYLHKDVEGSQRDDDGQKNGCRKADGKYSTSHFKEISKKSAEGPGNNIVNATDIL